MIGGIYGYSSGYGNYVYGITPVDNISKVTSNSNSPETKALKRAGIVECKTCSERKYQDGSDEMVSFKSPGHISPSASGTAVRAHEQEHVANAYKKAANNNGEVMSTSVSLKTSTCPECGRSYVAGGNTTTQIKYNESNPYDMSRKSYESESLAGQFVDYVA